MKQSDGDLLAAVYAAPEDDAPRLGYAEALRARGLPLGEFIALQVARAKSGKRPAPNERRLFDPTFWPAHPVSRAVGGAIAYEDVWRGFPSAFRPALPVSPKDLDQTVAAWTKLAGDPGWATVSRIHVPLADGPGLEALLLGHPLPSLEWLDGINARMLTVVAKLPLPARELTLWDDGKIKPARVTGWSKLESLHWYHWSKESGGAEPKPPIAEAVERIAAFGLLERIDSVDLGNYTLETCVDDLFGLIHAHPQLESITFGGWPSTLVRKGKTLSLCLSGHTQPVAFEALARLPESARAQIDTLALSFPKYDKTPKPERARLVSAFEKVRGAW